MRKIYIVGIAGVPREDTKLDLFVDGLISKVYPREISTAHYLLSFDCPVTGDRLYADVTTRRGAAIRKIDEAKYNVTEKYEIQINEHYYNMLLSCIFDSTKYKLMSQASLIWTVFKSFLKNGKLPKTYVDEGDIRKIHYTCSGYINNFLICLGIGVTDESYRVIDMISLSKNCQLCFTRVK